MDMDTLVACPSTLTVNDLGDTGDSNPGDRVCANSSGKCTLRAAIEEANAITACTPLTVNFSVTGTINLATALPNLNHPSLTIAGPSANQLTVQRSTTMGTPNFSVFVVNSGKVVNLSGLKVTNGNASFTGGALTNQDGTLNVSNSTISNNMAATYGGGLLNISNGSATTTTLSNCTISGNSAPGGGTAGGIDTTAQTGAATVNLVNCTVTLNTGSGGGSFGGIGSFNAGAAASM